MVGGDNHHLTEVVVAFLVKSGQATPHTTYTNSRNTPTHIARNRNTTTHLVVYGDEDDTNGRWSGGDGRGWNVAT